MLEFYKLQFGAQHFVQLSRYDIINTHLLSPIYYQYNWFVLLFFGESWFERFHCNGMVLH